MFNRCMIETFQNKADMSNLKPSREIDSFFLSVKSKKFSKEDHEGPVAMATGRRHWSEKYMCVSMDEGKHSVRFACSVHFSDLTAF